MNPWGITDTEADLMDALCEVGLVNEAAQACGITTSCATARLRCAALRMAGHKPHAARYGIHARPLPTIVACIRWSEFAAKHAVEKAGA